jgi:hypothetical protein
LAGAEVIKVVRAADPAYIESIRFFYGPRLPTLRFDNVGAPFRRLALKVVAPVVEALVAIFSTQGQRIRLCHLQDRPTARMDGAARRPAACFPREGQRTRPGLYAGQGAANDSQDRSKQPSKQRTDA